MRDAPLRAAPSEKPPPRRLALAAQHQNMLTLVAAATASAALLSGWQGAPRAVVPTTTGAAVAPVDNWGRRALCSSAALASAAPLLPADAAQKDWTVVNLPILSETAPILFDIEFDSKDRNLGWIVGNRGTFLQTGDAGKSWTAKSFANLDPDEEINYRFTKVSFMDGACRSPHERISLPPRRRLLPLTDARATSPLARAQAKDGSLASQRSSCTQGTAATRGSACRCRPSCRATHTASSRLARVRPRCRRVQAQSTRLTTLGATGRRK